MYNRALYTNKSRKGYMYVYESIFKLELTTYMYEYVHTSSTVTNTALCVNRTK